ncbi:efflux RND transporter permease subunit [Kushneria aurantia]|uniref:Efflux RND transporter permease subunit n=1 Tax=Kushneria aurantia TaxID=504092 RepID=A0ABV6G3M2_9GAMM|nr:efflux RND transporter permease subunit [Kushneria aurantia]
MNIAAPFIHRPIATSLLTLAVLLGGVLAWARLPVAPLPAVSFPTLMVTASLPGANPETMASTVATPLERSLGQIAGISQLTSSSSEGSTRITVQFDPGKDINEAARQVQAAINRAEALLPSAMTDSPTLRRLNPAEAPIMILTLTSAELDKGSLYRLADEQVAPLIARAQGVSRVSVGGSASPAVRVSLNPRRLESAGIGLDQVRRAIVATNSNTPTGFTQNEHYRWRIDSASQLFDAAAYRQLVIARSGEHVVHLGDVAEVDESVEDQHNIGFYNRQPAVVVVISPTVDANVIDTIASIRERLPQIRDALPASAELRVMLDRSPGIRASLAETQLTLLLAVALVILVILAFLRSPRATLIPAAVIPVSLLGTFMVMFALGFSLNTLSLMALIIAIGFVVDDAIVVVENISRHIEAGMSVREAALSGAREVGFTVLSMSLSLVAVFIPMLLLGGFAGSMFREFAVTLSAAVLMSLLVSLSLTPMLCSRWLGRKNGIRRPGPVERSLTRFGAVVLRGYATTLDIALRHRRLTLVSLLAVIMLNGWLYVHIDKGFIPSQDTGRLIGALQADRSISFDAMAAKLEEVRDRLLADDDVESVLGFLGGNGPGGGGISSATLFVTLSDDRQQSTNATANRLIAQLSDIPGAQVFMRGLSDVQIGGRSSSNSQYELTLKSDDLALLNEWSSRVAEALRDMPQITGVDSDNLSGGQAVRLVVDRDRAAQLGLDMREIDRLLGNAFAQSRVSRLYEGTSQYFVVMEVAERWRRSAQSLEMLHIVNDDGTPVPLAAFSHFARSTSPISVNHQDQFAAATLSFNLMDGVALSEATDAIEQRLDELSLPVDVQADFEGSAASFQSSATTMPLLVLAALITVYLVLGILYESTVHPLTILSTLPSAGIGALLALMLLDMPFSLIAMIGIIMLVGVVKKNAIMLVDFALDAERSRNLDALTAVREAALVRFRPIMMTTLSAILGALPLVLGSDENAALRAPLGVTIIGGLIVSQLLTLYTTPVVYLYLDRLRRRRQPNAGV